MSGQATFDRIPRRAASASGRPAAPTPTSGGRVPGSRSSRTGRRPGESGARADILAAARTLFADLGYEGATIRAVASRAGVDPALVHHYFGSKERLLEAALTPPVVPALVLPELVRDGPDTLGERALRFFLCIWDDPELREVYTAIVRCAVSPTATAVMRRVVIREVILPITHTLDAPDAHLRASLLASQFIGLAMVRYVAGVEPLASAPTEQVVRAVGPTIQRYLTGELDVT